MRALRRVPDGLHGVRRRVGRRAWSPQQGGRDRACRDADAGEAAAAEGQGVTPWLPPSESVESTTGPADVALGGFEWHAAHEPFRAT